MAPPSSRSLSGRTRRFDLRNGPGRVDKPDVTEGLREVAEELSAEGIDLLSEQADIVDEGGGPFEDGPGPSRCPARAKAWASQKVHRRNAPSSPASESSDR